MSQRQEVLNVILAQLLQERGADAPASIQFDIGVACAATFMGISGLDCYHVMVNLQFTS
jgi:hypothetical protein